MNIFLSVLPSFETKRVLEVQIIIFISFFLLSIKVSQCDHKSITIDDYLVSQAHSADQFVAAVQPAQRVKNCICWKIC